MKALSCALPKVFEAETSYRGLQLASAVLLAFAGVAAAGLREPLWAAMTVLVVMRPTLDSTLSAGVSRALATIFGALCGVLGIVMERYGLPLSLSILSIIVPLAYASTGTAALRGAPVGALIILSSSAFGQYSALGVAVLRLVHVAIGLAAASSVALIAANQRAAERVRAGCARLLHGASARLAEKPVPPQSRDTVRIALGRLTSLAEDADRTAIFPFLAKKRGIPCRELVATTGRLIQCASTLGRLLALQAERETIECQELASAAAAILSRAAGALTAGAPLERPAATGAVTIQGKPELMFSALLELMQADVRVLSSQLRQNPRSGSGTRTMR